MQENLLSVADSKRPDSQPAAWCLTTHLLLHLKGHCFVLIHSSICPRPEWEASVQHRPLVRLTAALTCQEQYSFNKASQISPKFSTFILGSGGIRMANGWLFLLFPKWSHWFIQPTSWLFFKGHLYFKVVQVSTLQNRRNSLTNNKKAEYGGTHL